MIRWWPPVALTATMLLGWAVGKGSTAVDDAFGRWVVAVLGTGPRWLLICSSWALLGPLLVACVAVAAYRRQWWLAGAVLVCPFVTIAIAQALKRLFDRRNGPYLEYPSGHTVLMVSVVGVAVVVAGARLWAVAAAAVISLLGMLGLIACGYHYLTDTLGAALLATALVCVAAQVGGRPTNRRIVVRDP